MRRSCGVAVLELRYGRSPGAIRLDTVDGRVFDERRPTDAAFVEPVAVADGDCERRRPRRGAKSDGFAGPASAASSNQAMTDARVRLRAHQARAYDAALPLPLAPRPSRRLPGTSIVPSGRSGCHLGARGSPAIGQSWHFMTLA